MSSPSIPQLVGEILRADSDRRFLYSLGHDGNNTWMAHVYSVNAYPASHANAAADLFAASLDMLAALQAQEEADRLYSEYVEMIGSDNPNDRLIRCARNDAFEAAQAHATTLRRAALAKAGQA